MAPRACLAIVFVYHLAATSAAETKDGFTPLFNGKDLAGWKVIGGKADVWGVTPDGIVFVNDKGGGWLMTEKEYSDFDLQLEFKLPVMGNSGVGIRSPHTTSVSSIGIEIQILDDPNYEKNYKDLKPTQYTGSIYDVVPPSKHVNKPTGEWNTMRIIAKGPKIQVVVNGEKIIDANLEDHKDRLKENKEKKLAAHPGLARPSGYLGLQSHDGRVEFRNVKIRELK